MAEEAFVIVAREMVKSPGIELPQWAAQLKLEAQQRDHHVV